uniref:uncharacterized protein LOC122607908 n=1 Tax=Erigeron canadensis TaxID=72917 RepID=UPI001CB89C07|nr:uncharacterized protein LOC122607908 [Erigeron canadensis]
MWGFASKPIAGTSGLNNDSETTNQVSSESSDDDMTLNDCRREEGLECPICFESFNIVENVPYVLWCGHTLCKNCVLGLPWAVYKLPNLPIQLPFFISCPWCNLLSCRLVYKGELKFPHKNYFLLWMVENLNGDRFKSCSSSCDHLAIDEVSQCVGQSQSTNGSCAPHFNAERLQSSLCKSLFFLVNLMTKFPLVFLFLFIVVYAIPASIAILVVYILITILFAIPSFLILYFSYPGLDWIVNQIVT